MGERKQVAVLFGGRSAEHEISILTALQLMSAFDVVRHRLIPVYIDPHGRWWTGDKLLEKGSYPINPAQLTRVHLIPEPGEGGLRIASSGDRIPLDLCLLAFHGQKGEDGAVQGLLEMAELPYTGCGRLASAVAMHKGHCKALFAQAGIPILPWVALTAEEVQRDLQKAEEKIAPLGDYPLFVKPMHLGSSIAIGKATDRASLHAALANVFKHDERAIVEPFIQNLMEINISVLEGELSPIEIPVASEEVLTYEDKYLRNSKNKGISLSDGMASLTRIIDPADLEGGIKEQVRTIARQAYDLLECHGVVRFDFMLDLESNKLYFNELNVIPGSMSFYLWEEASPRLLYTELLNKLIDSAEERHVRSCYLHKNLGFTALQGSR